VALLDIRQRAGYLFLAVMVGHVILISAQVNARTGVPVLEAVTFGVFAEIQRASWSVVSGVRDFWGGYVGLRDVRDENEALRRQLAEVQIQLQEQRALADRSRGLEQLLGLRDRLNLETTAAEVIASGASTEFATLTIDKGTQHGLRADMAVIAPGGVVGRIIVPSPRHAKVQLLIDRDAAAGALVQRTRAQGVLIGRPRPGAERDGLLRLEKVSETADIVEGDVGHRGDLSERVRHRTRRVDQEEWSGLRRDHRQASRRLFEPRGSAGRADAAACAGDRRGDQRVKVAGVVVATALALALQTTLANFLVRGPIAVDLVLVVVIYAALASGPVSGLLTGTFAGLVQDALSSGVIGIGGLAKTLVGFFAGVIGTQFIVTQPLPRFVVFFGATVVEKAVFIGLYELLGLRDFGLPYARVLGEAAGNAVTGVVAFQLAELLPGAMERRRATRTGFRR
jgi:rod shape-determining protein MreC